jgi:hypothetical protein
MRPPTPPSPRARWSRSPERAALLALFAEVDALLAGWACACSEAGIGGSADAQCCHFAVTGREPYPTAVELEEVRHAMRAASIVLAPTARKPTGVRSLPVVERVDLRPCPLLSAEGRCRIYGSRPFGCRTFFCNQKLPRQAVGNIGRRIADLSARFAPRDPGPRPLVRALADGRH